tara:strand:- start:479 stop:799 length:321 start_codon:yes stop_codon:yes gene_type:complete
MNATELRLGNWVINPFGTLFQITVIDERMYGFEPIPITEEWLVKFGFKDNNYTFDLMANRKKLSFGWYSMAVSSGVRSGFTMNKYKHIKHVHSLQNLYFALTGQEL